MGLHAEVLSFLSCTFLSKSKNANKATMKRGKTKRTHKVQYLKVPYNLGLFKVYGTPSVCRVGQHIAINRISMEEGAAEKGAPWTH